MQRSISKMSKRSTNEITEWANNINHDIANELNLANNGAKRISPNAIENLVMTNKNFNLGGIADFYSKKVQFSSKRSSFDKSPSNM